MSYMYVCKLHVTAQLKDVYTKGSLRNGVIEKIKIDGAVQCRLTS